MESHQLVSEFMSITGAKQNDAVSCLKTWAWDLKRALTDYNDTYTNELENKQTADDVEYEEITTTSIQGDFQNSINQRRSKLTKSDSVDIVDYRKLSRGISRATDNVNLVSRARTEIAMDFHNNREKNIEQPHSIDTPDYTFILPNIFNYPNPFRCFLERDLVECSTLSALEQTQRLNWWVESGSCRKLWPLATTGDGNCLLHAASLGMWGFHDRKLTLRRALYSILSTGKCKDSLLRRWRFQQTRFNKKAGFVYSENEWKKEWDEIVAMASPEPRNNSHNSKELRKSQRLSTPEQNGLSTDGVDDLATYESLEEIHILALAHVLRRTIIVIADTVLRDLNGEAMAPIPFGGIYLPFEISANECNRGPLLLAYDMAHFSALVTMESENDFPPPLIPLTDYENILLPIQFCIDPGEDFDWKTYDGSEGNWALTDREHITLLREYLDIVYATNTRSPEDEIYEDLTDDEFEKKFSESEVTIGPAIGTIGNFSNDDNHTNNKSKAAKQLQSVAKQFGSIGKSMSKKIKKNIGSITKIGGKNLQKKPNLSSGNSTQSFTCMRILCARLRVKRHDFQEEMIRNYLECAHSRFLESEKNKDKQDVERHNLDLINDTNEINRKSSFVYCINTGCNNFASSETSYLCPDCFEKQCHRESAAFLDSAPRYGTGKSKFYTQADTTSHDSIKQLPSVRRLNELDQTLYLSNSTFYNDNVTGYNEIGIPNRESLYRHGYSPTVKLTDNNIKIDEQLGTVSVFSPGNTINNKSQNINSNIMNVVELPSSINNQNLNRVSSSSSSSTSASATASASSSSSPCRTHGCMYYGSANNNFYCSRCCQKRNSDTVFSNASQQNIVYNTTAASTTTPTPPPPPTSIAKTNSKIMSDI